MVSSKFTTASPLNVVVDYNDIADGSGVVSFLPFVARDTAVIYRMDRETNTTEIRGTGSPVTSSKVEVFNLDFDSKVFNISRTIYGTALLRLPIDVQPNVSDQIITMDATITLYRLDGGSEVETIGSVVALSRDTNVGSQFPTPVTMIEIDCDKTFIGQGQQIRLNVVIDAQITTGSTSSCDIAVGHDPEDNEFSYDGPASVDLVLTDTIMKLNIPFEVQ